MCFAAIAVIFAAIELISIDVIERISFAAITVISCMAINQICYDAGSYCKRYLVQLAQNVKNGERLWFHLNVII